MADNKEKDEKIAELEDRIVALEEHSLVKVPSVEPTDAKKKKAQVASRLHYICGRIEGRYTITSSVYEDLVKYTSYNEEDEEKIVDGRREKVIISFNKVWKGISEANEDFINNEESWTAVINKISTIVGISDKDAATSRLLDA